MSTRGRSGPSRWLMGGVVDRVMRGSNVPVLLVRNGKVQPSIKSYLSQVGADTLVLGYSRTGSPPQAFTLGEIQRFSEAVRQDLGIEVIVAT